MAGLNILRRPGQWLERSAANWRRQHGSHAKPLELFKASLRNYRDHKRVLLLVVLTVILPVALLANFAIDPSSDTSLAAYLTFAELAMNAALVYALVQLLDGKAVGVKEAYYKGSAMLVRMVLVALLLAVMLLPLMLGLLIFAYGVVAPGTQLNPSEKTTMGLLALLVVVPSIVMITRSLWGLYAIFETDHGPWDAIRHSWRVTRGKTVITFGRLIALIGLLLLMLLLPVGLLAVLANLTQNILWLVIMQVVIALIVLPLSNIYLYRFYRELK